MKGLAGSGCYASTILEPDWEAWPRRLDANRQGPPARCVSWPRGDVSALRQQMLAAARRYVEELYELARQREILLTPLAPTDYHHPLQAAPRPLVLTGHQPTILHPGLIFKVDVTQQFAQEQNASAVVIWMDTDTGDAGQFAVPVPDPSPGPWSVGGDCLETLTEPSPLFCGQRVRTRGDLSQVAERVRSKLKQCRAGAAAAHAGVALETYQKLAGCSAVQANSIVRRVSRPGASLLELPFSRLCALPTIQQFLHDIALDGVGFHDLYNQTLASWRKERKLRNPANPFPDLGRQDDLYELPLWRVGLSTKRRQAVWARPTPSGVQLLADQRPFALIPLREHAGFVTRADDDLLVPRGALITIVFRLLCSDLFVHGLGGRSYDAYTDTLIETYFQTPPPAFVVASASRYLFAAPRTQVADLDRVMAQQRELAHHPERYLGAGYFSVDLERQLGPMIERKEHLVESLRAKKVAGTSAAQEGRELHALQNQLKSLVAEDLADRGKQHAALSEPARAALVSRTYPWFYFSWDAGEA